MIRNSLHRRGTVLPAAGTDEPSSVRSGDGPAPGARGSERPPFQQVVDLAPRPPRGRHPRTGLLHRLRAALAA